VPINASTRRHVKLSFKPITPVCCKKIGYTNFISVRVDLSMLYDATVCIKFIYRTGYFFEAYAIISCVLPFNFKDIRLSLTLSVIFCDCPVREACCPRRPGQVSQATKAALRGNRASRTSRERVRCRRILRCCSEGRVSTACPGAHVRLLYPRYWPALPEEQAIRSFASIDTAKQYSPSLRTRYQVSA
jgi:hypothetical protein